MNSDASKLLSQDFNQIFLMLRQQVEKSEHFKRIFEDMEGYYEGEVVNEMKHGIGTQVLPSGEKYEGYWRNNLKNGFGRLTYANRDVYTGYFRDNKENGTGKMEFFSKGNEIYEGDWQDGRGIGQGVYVFSDDLVYRGEVWNCEPNGFGQLTSKEQKYIGQFKHADFHGDGKLENLLNCTVYDGSFRENKRHGFGFFLDQKNALHFEG